MQPQTVIVGFHPHADARQRHMAHRKISAQVQRELRAVHTHVLHVRSEWNECKQHYESLPHVRFVEPLYTYRASYDANDPLFSTPYPTSHDGKQSQWFLRHIRAPQAWDVARRVTDRTTIAILDTGIDPHHPELADLIVGGANFTSPDHDNIRDESGHGTHAAGLAAALTDQRRGIACLAFNSTCLLPVKVLNGDGSGTNEQVANGILFAADQGARIINVSLGGTEYSQLIQDAVRYAWRRGCVIIAAAGNSGSVVIEYPAGNNYALAVSAANENDERHPSSSYGLDIAVAAPGHAILSTMPTYTCDLTRKGGHRHYDALSGTSMSAPIVSALAGMLAAQRPYLTNQQIVHAIQRSALPLGTDGQKLWTPEFGYGRIDAARAVREQWVPAATGSLYGQATNRDGCPRSGVTVSCRDATYRTRADGMFRLGPLPPGRHPVLLDGKVNQHATVTTGCDTFIELR